MAVSAANPYMVDISGQSYGRELAGLGKTFANVKREREQREVTKRAETRYNEAQQEITSAWQSGDPNQLFEASLKYPEWQKIAQAGMGILTDEQQQSA